MTIYRFLSYQVRFSEYLEKKNVVTDFLSVCETRSGISKLYLAYGVIVFLTLYLVIGYGTDILTLLVGALYPAYQSVKAIETHEKEDDTKWLTYWVVFASVQLFEACTAMMVYYLPLYPIIKLFSRLTHGNKRKCLWFFNGTFNSFFSLFSIKSCYAVFILIIKCGTQ
ncbi:unnamed protein product [Schistosoma margrebowiei]|uniref:Receptor expression-enhancing protein n=1 Tax=Schistosoma margrebowiei TaxID=48269 RepID=A0A183LFF4_9TREM|nr:unnamed protein product [Schistosoma margrebowiei]